MSNGCPMKYLSRRKAILGWAVLGKIQTNRYFHNSNGTAAQQDNRIFLSLCQIDPRKINKQNSIHRFNSWRL